MGALQVGEHVLPARGQFRLQGSIIYKDDGGQERVLHDATFYTKTIDLLDIRGNEIGRMLMGYPEGNILMFDGVEIGIGQKNDPGKLRFFGYYEDGTPGQEWGGGGVISWNVLRRDGIMEEVVMLNAGSKDNPRDYTGMFRVLMRTSNDQEDWKVVQMAEAGGGTYATGLGNFLGWLGKHANRGEQPPAPNAAGGKVTRFSTDHGEFCINWQDDGDAPLPTGIIYNTNGTPDETAWTAVGRVKLEPL